MAAEPTSLAAKCGALRLCGATTRLGAATVDILPPRLCEIMPWPPHACKAARDSPGDCQPRESGGFAFCTHVGYNSSRNEYRSSGADGCRGTVWPNPAFGFEPSLRTCGRGVLPAANRATDWSERGRSSTRGSAIMGGGPGQKERPRKPGALSGERQEPHF